ncbi:hypothetical protein BaRGS_00016849 [Batillaria attramentaria]|uniref:Uncharacterized protein n=1 Tax=Batillaria attramentaria TaxID=370345 RepID=A0ABD0KYC6_9CAEN
MRFSSTVGTSCFLSGSLTATVQSLIQYESRLSVTGRTPVPDSNGVSLISDGPNPAALVASVPEDPADNLPRHHSQHGDNNVAFQSCSGCRGHCDASGSGQSMWNGLSRPPQWTGMPQRQSSVKT